MNLLKLGISLSAAMAFGVAGAEAQGSTQGRLLYVATDGNNSWSGRLPAPNAAQTDGPLASIRAARDHIRAARGRNPGAAPSAVMIRGGRYEISEPIVFAPEDSGSPNRPIVYAAYKDERPVISGGRRITGWEKGPNGIWTVQIPAVRAGQWSFRQLFINDRRCQRARAPNKGFFRIDGLKSDAQPFEVHFKNTDLQESWASLGDVEFVGLFSWADLRMPIRKVDMASHTGILSGNGHPYGPEADARYYIENAPELLDSPGEWYLDRKTGILSYMARKYEDVFQAEVVAPEVTRLVSFDGAPSQGKFVSHIILRGLTFQDADWSLGPDGYADVQAAVEIGGALKLTGALDCAIEHCTIRRIEGYALDVGRGSKRNQVVGNAIFDAGAGGIKLGWGNEGLQPPHSSEGYVVYSNPAELNSDNVVTDNDIYDLGSVFPSGVGIWAGQTINSTISHNHIHDLNYSGISVGWNWGYGPNQCHHNRIEYNHIHGIGRGILSDLGGIYTLGIQPGTLIRNNLIHDVSVFVHDGHGIYLDEGSSNIVVENNVVYRTEHAGFQLHYGRQNIVRNNIFALGKEFEIRFARPEDHLSMTFERNILYVEGGAFLEGDWSGSNRSLACTEDSTAEQHNKTDCRHYRIDGNIYYNAHHGGRPFADSSFSEWRERGNDRTSIFADPEFENLSQYNFNLRPTSPALKKGFKPIDLSTIGPRRSNVVREGTNAP